MASRNDITGDSLTTKSATDAFRNGWDRIFGKKEVKQDPSSIRGTLTDEQRQALRELTDHIQKEKEKGDDNVWS